MHGGDVEWVGLSSVCVCVCVCVIMNIAEYYTQ